jgi:hypothetical protein
MDKPENSILKLNEMLEADQFDLDEFKRIIGLIEKAHNADIKVLDFEYYNEERLSSLQREKIERIKTQDFENAAKIREFEKECESYISIRTDYGIEKSEFYYDPDYLFYFYFGTAKNDIIVRKFITLSSLKI